MKDVRNLCVTQVRIFQEDVIPYQVFSIANKLKQLKDYYQFSGEEVPFPLHEPQTPKLILFKAGESKLEKETLIINLLAFEGRKITLEIGGKSEGADKVFLDLANFINQLAGLDLLNEGKCLVKTEETKCNVTLDIDFWDVFDEKMKEFIKNDLYLACERPTLSISPKTLSFEIIFEQDPELQKHNVSFAPKHLTVEPRANVPLENRVFYTHSPFDSETHLRLVKSFEDIFLRVREEKSKVASPQPKDVGSIRHVNIKKKEKKY